MKLILLCILLSLALCQEHSDQQLISFNSGLQFSNITGSGLTPQQMSFFISIANYASRVYGDNIEQNLKYIKARMDQFYGKTLSNFYVFIQTDQDKFFWSISILSDKVYAGVEGINDLYPNWSYLFVKYIGSNVMSEYVYFHNGVGSGFTKNLVEIITSAIWKYQGDSCNCEDTTTSQIRNALSAVTTQTWSIICGSLDTTYSLIRSYQDKWISIQPKNCYYTIYT